jgi:hypothetical protein
MKPNNTIKNHVRFKDEFNKEFKEEYPGRDLAEFVVDQLRKKSFTVSPVVYEDPWFSVKVVSGLIEYPLVISHSAIEEDYWEISCPRTLGKSASFHGKSEEKELQNIVSALNDILQNEQAITDIKWFDDYTNLTDDYVKEPILKCFNIFWKYFERLFFAICVTGLVLCVVGSFLGRKESLLLRIGTTIFLLPICVWFGLGGINFITATGTNIWRAFHNGQKKIWIRWLLVFMFGAAFFFIGALMVISLIRMWFQ